MTKKDDLNDNLLDKLGLNASDKFAVGLSDEEKYEFQDKIKQTQGLLGKDLATIPDKLLPPEEKKKREEFEKANKKEISWLSYFFIWLFRLGFVFGKPKAIQRHEIKNILRTSASETGFYKNRFFLETLAQKLDFFYFNCYQITSELKMNPFVKNNQDNLNQILKKDVNKPQNITKDMNYKWQQFFLTYNPGTKEIRHCIENLKEDKIREMLSIQSGNDTRDYVRDNLSGIQTALQQYKEELENDYNTLKNLVKIIYYDMEAILKKFSPKYSVTMRKSMMSFKKAPEEELVNELISFYRYINQYDFQIPNKHYVNLLKILISFVKTEVNPDIKEEEITSFLINIYNVIKELREPKYSFKVGRKKGKTDAITICLKAATKNEFFYVDTKFSKETFVKDFFDHYKEDIKNIIAKIQKEQQEKEKNKKINDLFGGTFSEVNPTYNETNVNIINESNKVAATFNYVKDVNVIIKYLDIKYNQFEHALIDIINTNMLLDTYIKGSETAGTDFEGIQKCMKSISDYLQMIVSPFRRSTEDTSRDTLYTLIQDLGANPSTFDKIGILEDRIIKIDIAARAIVEKFYSCFNSLYFTLDLIIKADKNAAIYRPDKNFQQNFSNLLKRIGIIRNNIGAVLAVLDFSPKS